MEDKFLISLYEDVMFMCKDILVKRQDLADKYETLETAKAFERYLAISRGEDYFFSYERLDEGILTEVLPTNLLAAAMRDRRTIPEQYRDIIVEKHATLYYDNYVENNNYYRMLNGLPDLDDTFKIYITDIDGVSPTTPVHQLSDEEISIVLAKGKLDELIAEYPTKKYLKFLGSKKLGILKCRLAKPFQILSIPDPTNSKSKESFLKEYYMARRYIMATCYNKNLFADNELYDSMLGVVILCTAVRNTLTPDLMSYMSYDEMLNSILKSYDLDIYFSSLPLLYKQRLIKNLDKIISRKGTDSVLLDICGIFAYDNITVNRYYLFKRHVRDNNGDLIFPKLEDNSPDYDTMYRLDFLKSDIKNDSIDVSSENIIEYSSVTSKDPLWQLSESDVLDIKKEDFNLMMSKYISIEAAYNITELVYEINYFLNLLLDSRYNVSNLYLPNIYSETSRSDLFTMIVFLLAIMSKKNNYDGNIITTPASVAQIYKFNLTAVKANLDSIITKYKLGISSNDLLLSKPEAVVSNPDQLVNVYVRNTTIYDYIINEINTTKDYRKYTGLMEIKKLLYSSALTESVFKKSDGTTATTYLDMVNDLDVTLQEKITAAETTDELDNMSIYVLNRLQEFFNTNKLQFLFINTPDMHDKLIKVHLKQAIELFKASSAELDSVDIFFKLDSDTSTVRFFDKNIKNTGPSRIDFVEIDDKITKKKTLVLSDTLTFSDNIYLV